MTSGLRERKKARTRETLREQALRLFLERGYDATTMEAVAAAADVAPRTLFRYFPTKESLLLEDDYDPLLLAALRARPAGESPLSALPAAVRSGLDPLYDEAKDALLARTRLIQSVPSLRGGLWDQQMRTVADIAAVLAERAGRPAGDHDSRIAAAAGMATLTTAVLDWADGNGREDLRDVIDRAFEALARAG